LRFILSSIKHPFLKPYPLRTVGARRLDFGYLRTMSGVNEKSFPMIIRTVSMLELAIIFPSLLIGLYLFVKGNVILAVAPLMLAFYVLVYDEKSVPFYYHVLAFVMDLITGEKTGSVPKKAEPVKISDLLKKYKRELDILQVIASSIAVAVMLRVIQLEIYAEKINMEVLIGFSVITGLLIAFAVIKLVRALNLVSKL
jgi:hypothetical protein